MNSHLYLIRTGIKNRIKEILHKPGKLVLYLIVIAIIIAGIIFTVLGAEEAGKPVPTDYFLPIFFAFLILFYSLSVKKGLSSGDTIFEMSDVNLLFVSPVNPRSTLLYGVVRLVGMSFWAGFFILFQSTSLSRFGIGFDGVLILFAVFILNMIVLTLMAQVIYCATNGNPRRKRVVQILAIAIFLPLIVFVLIRFIALGDMVFVLNDVIDVPILAATPFVGWASAGAIALIKGNLFVGFAWLGLLTLSGIIMLLYIMFSRSDYYEDVLVATETAFEKKRAAAEGNIQTAGSTNAKVKVSRTGLGGAGAKVFLSKHLRETFRKNRLGFFSVMMIIEAIAFSGLAYFLRGELDIVTGLQVLMWIQVFLIGTGRGLLETYSHYIYMVPCSPFKKLIWSNMELMMRVVIESVLLLAIPGAILSSPLLVIIGCMAVYILFSLMILGVNYLSMRVTGANISNGILLTIYFVSVLLVVAPGLAAALIFGYMIGGSASLVLGLIILAAWELVAALICFMLSRNILHNCDMPVMKK